MGKTLNKAVLSKVEIDICSMKKQRMIVKILDKVSYVIKDKKRCLSELDNLIFAVIDIISCRKNGTEEKRIMKRRQRYV